VAGFGKSNTPLQYYLVNDERLLVEYKDNEEEELIASKERPLVLPMYARALPPDRFEGSEPSMTNEGGELPQVQLSGLNGLRLWTKEATAVKFSYCKFS
jgi:hypothetical protein